MPHDRIVSIRRVERPGAKAAWWVAARTSVGLVSVIVTTSQLCDYRPFRSAMLRRRGVLFENPDYRGHGGGDRWDERLRRVMMVNEEFNRAATVAV